MRSKRDPWPHRQRASHRPLGRQEKSRPIIDELTPQLHAKLVLISQRTQLADTILYALSRWQRLTCLIDDSRIFPTSPGIVDGHSNSQIDDLACLGSDPPAQQDIKYGLKTALNQPV